MRIGITTGTFWPKPTFETLKIFSSFGVSNIEVTLQTDEFFLDFNGNLNFAVFEKIKEEADRLKIKVASVHAPHFQDEQGFSTKTREKLLKKSLEVCSMLGGEILVLHPVHIFTTYEDAQGFLLGGKSLEKAFLGNFRAVLSEAGDLKVKLTLENICTFSADKFFNDPENMQRFLEEVRSPVMGMTLDIVHSELAGNTQRFLEKLGDKIFHIHVADVDSRKRRIPPGLGETDWPSLLSFFQKISSSSLMLELEKPQSKDVRMALDFLKSFLSQP